MLTGADHCSSGQEPADTWIVFTRGYTSVAGKVNEPLAAVKPLSSICVPFSRRTHTLSQCPAAQPARISQMAASIRGIRQIWG